MTSRERIDRGDNLLVLLAHLRGEDFGGHPACADVADKDLFFPASENLGSPVIARQIEQAKAVCRECPVRVSCLENALRTRAQGIWGGTTEAERRELRGQLLLVAVRGDAAGIARAAERALRAIEDVSGAPVPGLRRHVEDVLRWADVHGDADDDRAAAVLAVLRPEIERLSAGRAGAGRGVAA